MDRRFECGYNIRTTNNNGTHVVGAKSPNELGIYDMSGDVWELCSDWFDEKYYSDLPQNNPQGPESGTVRVCRDGAWCSPAEYSRVSDRKTSYPVARYSSVGFRIICSSKYTNQDIRIIKKALTSPFLEINAISSFFREQ